MISILIPVYDQDINSLVARLSAGFSHLQEQGEIIVMDDASQPAFRQLNQNITQLPYVQYIKQENNQGRWRIRQKLAEAAKGEWLLFLDGDSEIQKNDWLYPYLEAIKTKKGVIIGGRTYQQNPPADGSLMLHWKYGMQRESRGPHKKHQPAFMTNNFLIEAKYFRQLAVQEIGEGYGHEDTWIGIQLQNQQIPIHYIQNPVIHAGLETAANFIHKSEKALTNLHRLSKEVPPQALAAHVKLFRIYRTLKKWKLTWLPALLYSPLKTYIRSNLYSRNPSLKLFDLHRLQHFIKTTTPKS